MTKLLDLINQYAGEFETRADGSVHFKNVSTELHDAVYKAHGDRLPDNYIFKWFSEILDSLGNCYLETIDDVEDARGEIVDGLVDSYTSDLTEWLHDNTNNTQYLDRAVSELDARENILSTAQYLAIDEVYGYVVDLLRANYEGGDD